MFQWSPKFVRSEIKKSRKLNVRDKTSAFFAINVLSRLLLNTFFLSSRLVILRCLRPDKIVPAVQVSINFYSLCLDVALRPFNVGSRFPEEKWWYLRKWLVLVHVSILLI